MQAVVATAFGTPDVLEVRDVPDLASGTGQVLVDVQFSDVGTLDRLVRSGWGREYFDVHPPYVPGDGVGGVVRAVGSGVDRSWIGRRVVGGTGPRGDDGMSVAPTGGYAEAALVDARSMLAVPEELSLETATALLNDGTTSRLLLDATVPRRGDTVLVLSAAGAAGVLLVQAAAARVLLSSRPPAVPRRFMRCNHSACSTWSTTGTTTGSTRCDRSRRAASPCSSTVPAQLWGMPASAWSQMAAEL